MVPPARPAHASDRSLSAGAAAPDSPPRPPGSRSAVGVLALQGDFAAHARALERVGVEACEVRRPDALDDLAGLVIPGGESTTLLKHLEYEPGWWPALGRFRARGGALLGTCAGLILLAREVRSPAQRSLGFLDVVVVRNAYGRQRESFEGLVAWDDGRPLEAVFIRAPRIASVGPGVEVLASREGEPVLVSEGAVMAATFHPELTGDPSVHQRFLDLVVRRTDA